METQSEERRQMSNLTHHLSAQYIRTTKRIIEIFTWRLNDLDSEAKRRPEYSREK